MGDVDRPREKSRVGLILGIVGGLTVLAAIAGVAVWYFFFRKKAPSTTTTGTTGTTATGGSCSSDSSCTSGKFCIAGTCTTEPTSCSSNSQCGTGTGRYCSSFNNKCQNKCTSDSQCTTLNSLAICDIASGKCQLPPTGGSCSSDIDCPIGQVCTSGNCVSQPIVQGSRCDATPQCPTGLICTNGGTCEAIVSTCSLSSECETGLECISGLCAVFCGAVDCRCDGTGQGSCNTGLNCVNFYCAVPTFAALGESCIYIACGSGMYCNGESFCGSGAGAQTGEACTTLANCQKGDYCVSNFCSSEQ